MFEKPAGALIDDEFSYRIKPYNAALPRVENPMVFCECKTEIDVKEIIHWAKKHHGTLIPMGGNTNLIEATRYDPQNSISQSALVIMLSYASTRLSYCKTTHTLTCGAMAQLGEINAYLDQLGRRWDVNFSAQSATIGGIASTNAGGELAKAASQIKYVRMVCGNGKVHELKPHESQTDSVFPNAGTATQGLIGMISSVTIQTKPKWKSTCSAMLELPLTKVTEFRHFVQNHSPLVACELIDAASMKNVTGKDHQGMTLLLKWASEGDLVLDDFWEVLMDAYPDYLDSMSVSDSIEKEDRMWTIRHDVSDANRRWARQHNMEYVGYDLGIPKDQLTIVIQKIDQYVKAHQGQLFSFGHSMQSSTHDTMHCNIALPGNISKTFIPQFIQSELNNIDIQMAAEHGGCGHKSIQDSLNLASNQEMQSLQALVNKYDPHQLFRRDIKQLLDVHEIKRASNE